MKKAGQAECLPLEFVHLPVFEIQGGTGFSLSRPCCARLEAGETACPTSADSSDTLTEWAGLMQPRAD